MIDHAFNCACAVCRPSAFGGIDVEQGDRDLLADAWAKWRGASDGEVNKLRGGQNGAPGSPRWVALQAIASMRVAALAIREGR